MTNVLKEICDKKLEHIEQQKAAISEAILLNEISELGATKGFYNALKNKADAEEIGLIAEVKKASPSKGLIRADFNPVKIAKAYESAGATCVSILTDEPYFQGKDEYVRAVRSEIALPIIRKDFMLDPYQVLEARAMGADCILLIMAALEDSQAAELEAAAFEQGLDVLVEVHDEEETERALKLQSKLLGVNNRNLKTMDVNLANSENMSRLVPAGYTLVCESGVHTHDDILRMQKSDIFCFLVGESLMRQENVYKATQSLLNIA